MLALAAAAPAVFADTTLSYKDSFTDDDQLFSASFDLAADGVVSARTLSYGGGTNGRGQVISSGGFVPVLTLFEDSIGQVALAHGTANLCGDPGSGAADPISHFCWDANFIQPVSAGHYTLVLSQDGNEPGTFATDPYSKAGEHDYTGQSFLGQSGQKFIEITGEQRGRNWALDLSVPAGVPVTAVPEPATGALLAAGLLTLLGLARRRARR